MKYIFFLTLTVLATSCEECGECFTPPATFIFELVNEQDENIFTVESYKQKQISIVQMSNNESYEFQFISEDNMNVIQIGSIGWATEEVGLLFQLGEKEIFTFYVSAERKNEDCCTFTRYNDIKIEGADFELDSQTGKYKIIVE